MTKILIDEATVRLVLEALEYIYEGANNQGPHTGISWRCVSNKAEPVITALREALAKPDFWEGYVPEPVKPAQQEPKIDIYRSFEQWKRGNVLEHGVPRTEHYSEAQLDLVEMGWHYGYDAGRAVEQALDKKAENARELGLDYEPAQQEPVAWYDSKTGWTDFHSFKPTRKPSAPDAEWLPLYTTSPQPGEKNQEPVLWMMPDGKTVNKWGLQFYSNVVGTPLYKSPPAQRKPLTRNQVKKLITATGYDTASPQERTDFINGIRHAEAAHGIKENT
jgi:hypothetical protein